MPDSDLAADPLLESFPVREGYKVLGGVVLYQKLGQGGMGAVYRGKHLRLNVDVAVKVMAPPEGMSPSHADNFVQRFIREAQTSASVRHQNLIRVYDVNTEGGSYYLVMDYIDGESAGDRLKRKGKLAEREAVEIVLGAAQGLAEAHSQGIVHRDVKPDNVLIDKKGAVVVADLGLAKAYGASPSDSAVSMGLSMSRQAMGTPYYMSPEQTHSAKDVGPSADVWSLGVTLYQLVTGEVPWRETDLTDLINRIRNDPMPDPRRRCEGLSEGLCRFATKALEKNPSERYADCGEMVKALRKHLESLKTSPKSVLPDEEAGATKMALVSMTPPPSRTLTLISASALGDARARPPRGRAKRIGSVVVPLLLVTAVAGALAGWYFRAGPDPGREGPRHTTRNELDPKNGAAYGSQGRAKLEEGDFDGAIRDFDKAIRLDPESAATYVDRGQAKMLNGDLHGATRDYDRAIELEPKVAMFYFGRSLVKALKGDVDGAIRDLDKAIELAPCNAHYYQARATQEATRYDFDGVIQDLEKAIQLDPNFADADNMLALAYDSRAGAKAKKKDLDGAIRDYGRAIELDPGNAEYYDVRGMVKTLKGDVDGAIRDYDRAIGLEPGNASRYSKRGAWKASKGDLDSAIQDYARAIELEPGNSIYYRDRGSVRFAKGDVAGATRDQDEAIRLDPSNAGAYAIRGATRAKTEDWDGAFRDCDKAIMLDPNDAFAYHLRGLVRQAKGDMVGTEQDFETARRLGYSADEQ